MGYEGQVDEVYPEKGTVRVLLSIFGRETPTEIDHTQVEKTD
jgi:transcriptional antiterminator NusG